jgi:hypothetical protein
LSYRGKMVAGFADQRFSPRAGDTEKGFQPS